MDLDNLWIGSVLAMTLTVLVQTAIPRCINRTGLVINAQMLVALNVFQERLVLLIVATHHMELLIRTKKVLSVSPHVLSIHSLTATATVTLLDAMKTV